MTDAPFREAVIDLAALSANVATLRGLLAVEHVMAVVKADGYGHGAAGSARAALRGGADWLGVADLDEALALRKAGIGAPILAWLHDPGVDFLPALAADIDLGVSSLEQLEAGAAAQRRLAASVPASAPAMIQLKLETGLGRNGVAPADWPEVFRRARELELAGEIRVRGLFSHVSNASVADDREAVALFSEGLEMATDLGLSPEVLHTAASAAALRVPEARFNLVRLGISIYGLSPSAELSASELGLTPVMTLRGRIAAVRRVPAEHGVSYDYTYRTAVETTLALVPLGYADGVPRHASGRAQVSIGGALFSISGRVAMDQFVVDVGDHPVEVGDTVVLFGDALTGVPSADDWAAAADTINYEIVTRIGARVRRTFQGS